MGVHLAFQGALQHDLRQPRQQPALASQGQPVGCQKSAWPVSCSDGPESAVGHDDRPCPSVCSISFSRGCAAGWFCSAARPPPRTRNCSCYGTRLPCCAAPIPGPGLTGPTGRSSLR
jgi:hypothetical protein